MRISVVTGGTTTELTRAPIIEIKGSSVEAVGDAIYIAPKINITLSGSDLPVSRINMIQPNERGEFFIDGSECTSWDYLDDANGISLIDLCPSCQTCEAVYRLKYEVENMKEWINALKDVNLYYNDDVQSRLAALHRERITEDNDLYCSTDVQADPVKIKGLRLLNQYMTLVHMWNYVVSQNNSSNLITIAPEDTTGFVIQTKRALSSCAKQQHVRCTIQVRMEPNGIRDDGQSVPIDQETYPVSIYTPTSAEAAEIMFEPFDSNQYQSIALQGRRYMTKTSFADRPGDTDIKAYKKQATTCWTENDVTKDLVASVAGTYVVTVKFLPFVHYRAWRNITVNGHTRRQYITVRGGVVQTVSGQTIGNSVLYDFGIAGHSMDSLPDPSVESLNREPTEQDYLDAKTAPTVSVDFKLVWKIKITWQFWAVGSDISTAQTESQDYVYMSSGIRKYFGDKVIGDAEVPADIPVTPQPTPDTEATSAGTSEENA